MQTEERWPVPLWLTKSALALAGLGLLVVLWRVWALTTSAKAGLCMVMDGAPLTTFAYPSQVFVLTAIGAYLLGHVTSRYVVEVRPSLAALLGEDTFGQQGLVLTVKAFVTVFLLIATVLNLYEAAAFAQGIWPITYYVWCSTAASPTLALSGAAILSFLVGRWLWVAK